MSEVESSESSVELASTLRPAGVRIASTLCWIVGVLTVMMGLAIGIPQIATNGSWSMLVLNVVAGGLVIAGAVLVRKQRRLGVLLVAVAWAIPTVAALVAHQIPRGGPLLLIVALLLVLANWKHFE